VIFFLVQSGSLEVPDGDTRWSLRLIFSSQMFKEVSRYPLPISLILSFASPLRRLRQVMGRLFQVYPRTTAFNGISTVRLKCEASRGRHPSMVVFLYALNAFVMSLCSSRKMSCRNLFAIRFRKSLSRG